MLLGDICLNSDNLAPAADVSAGVEGESQKLGWLVRVVKIFGPEMPTISSSGLLVIVQATIGDDEADPELKKEALRLSALNVLE